VTLHSMSAPRSGAMLYARYPARSRRSTNSCFPPVPAVRLTVTIRPLRPPDSGPIVGGSYKIIWMS